MSLNALRADDRPRADIRRFWALSTTDTWSAPAEAGVTTG
jgi:hypothetical protein